MFNYINEPLLFNIVFLMILVVVVFVFVDAVVVVVEFIHCQI